MKNLKVLSHCSYIGDTGINSHSRNFFRAFSKHCDLKVRNYTVGSSWKGQSFTPHDGEWYVNDIDKKILYQQTLWNEKGRFDTHIYNNESGPFDVNIIADICDHYYYYDNYLGPKIGYFAWETNRVPDGFFEKLKELDEVWVTSGWQKECLIKQGFDPEKLQVVPEGVESDVFFPEESNFDEHYSDNRFKFIVFGRWEYRKSTKEIIDTFIKTFDKSEPVDLILSVDNNWPEDDLKSTQERLKFHGFEDSRLKIVHFPSRKDYIRFLKKGHVFLSCSRGEGWNLPLIEAMACGTPSIYSNCSGQLEYAAGKGHPVNILGETPSLKTVGSFYEPDFGHLSMVMRDVYSNYKEYKIKALKDSEQIRSKYTWDNSAKFAYERTTEVYKRYYKEKLKIVFIPPHLSTGGAPQYLLKKIKVLNKDHEIHCIEYRNYGSYAVQRNQVREILGNRFYVLPNEDDKTEMMNIINNIKPDIVHLEEMPEYFMHSNVAKMLYSKDRKYKIIETSHDSSFDPNNKMYFPDKILYVSKFQKENLRSIEVPSEVCEYPIAIIPRKPREEALKFLGLDPKLKHVVNIGLFTPRKNQAEIIEYAKTLIKHPIQFHFIGNQAPNFKHYWEPLMKEFPENCKWWDERKDVENFYQAADLFLFTSRGSATDKETSPLVIREAISYNIPSLIYNLPVYLGMYDKYENIQYLDPSSKINNLDKILKALNINVMNNKFYTIGGEEDLASYKYPSSAYETLQKYGDAATMYWTNYVYKELERFDVKVERGDVFVDLGTNIGMSSRYAYEQGAGEIYCFEPDPNLIDIIKKNVPIAKIYQNAIDVDIKELELYHWPYNPVNVGPKYKTSTVRLKDVIQMIGKPIDYLKIDIEGFEDAVFDTMTPEDLAPVKKMFIEHHIPDKIGTFCEKLTNKGWNVHVEYGSGQNFVYATKSKIEKLEYNFDVKWDWNEQKVTYSSNKDINFPIMVVLKEYKSNAVLWSTEYQNLSANCQYWMIPIPKNVSDYSTHKHFSGIKFCIYNKHTQEQMCEYPFFRKFVNMPTVSLSNKAPYFINYLEYFIDKKYDSWFGGKKFHTVVDVGANIGIFSEYLIQNRIARKIISVECDEDALSDLNKNYEFNDNVKIIPKGLSHTNEPLTFYKCVQNSIISTSISPEKMAHNSAGNNINRIKTTVETITIKELVKEFVHIDLLKIDIEGAEYSVFEHLDPSLAEHIDNIFLECHFFESDYREKYKKLLEKIIHMGYIIDDTMAKSIESYQGGSTCIFCRKK